MLYLVTYFEGRKQDYHRSMDAAIGQASDLMRAYNNGHYGSDPKPKVFEVREITDEVL